MLILDRDEPIATIERIKPNERGDGRLARLEQSGLVRRSRTARPMDALAKSKPPKPRKSVVEALVEERRDGR